MKKFLRRLVFYIIGLILGLLVVSFFFGDRFSLFGWLPEARIKDAIKTRQWRQNNTGKCYIKCFNLEDINKVEKLLLKGDVRFSISKTHREPHPVYKIDVKKSKQLQLRFHVEVGDSTLTLYGIEDISINDEKIRCNCPTIIYAKN